MENKNSRPFYLQSEKTNLRMKITIGVILLVIAFVSPPLLVIVLIYAVYLFLQIKKNKSEEVKEFENILDLYLKENWESCVQYCDDYKFRDNIKVNIIKALCLYENRDYNGYIHIISDISDKRISDDLDLVLKLAQSYEQIGAEVKAVENYKKLLKYYPNSKFLKEKLEKDKK